MNEQNNNFEGFNEAEFSAKNENTDMHTHSGHSRHSSKKDKHSRKFYQKKRFIIPIAIICIIAILCGVFFIMSNNGKKSLTNAANEVKLTVSDIEDYTSQEDIVVYKGVKYRYNENLATILCMGTDNPDNVDTATPGSAGQADAIFVLTVDTQSGKTSVLSIPRDSMTEIGLYSNNGNYMGTAQKQICLAYSYGDGKEKSCENTVDAVSRLLYGIPINSYLSVNMKAVGIITDKIGGVKITPEEDVVGSLGVMYKKGQTYTISGDKAMDFLRYRSKTNVDASYKRLNNQNTAFLKAMVNKFISQTKQNKLMPINCYNEIKGYAVTDIDTAQIAFLSTCVVSGSFNAQVEYETLKGETKMGTDNYVEFTPDKTDTFEKILKIFYTKVD